jgi:hypothetical protein
MVPVDRAARAVETRGNWCPVCTDSSTDSARTLEPMAPDDRADWAQTRETVHIYRSTRDGARARLVWRHL